MDVTPTDGLGAVGVAAMSESAWADLGGEKRVCGVPRLAGRRNPALGGSGGQDGKRQAPTPIPRWMGDHTCSPNWCGGKGGWDIDLRVTTCDLQFRMSCAQRRCGADRRTRERGCQVGLGYRQWMNGWLEKWKDERDGGCEDVRERSGRGAPVLFCFC